MSVHENSKESFREENYMGRTQTRRQEILRYLVGARSCRSDRQIMRVLGYTEMNQVRPRITELLKAGLLRESFKKIPCQYTGKSVRFVYAPQQAELELDLSQCERGVS